MSTPAQPRIQSGVGSRDAAPTCADSSSSTVRPATVIDSPRHGDELFYTFTLSNPLPVVDLASTVARRVTSPSAYAELARFMRRYFHLLVFMYRVGVPCFAASFFVANAHLRTALSIAGLPSSFAIISTALFVSTDILALLMRNYEFWFLVIINVLNWIFVGMIFNDIRASLCFVSWMGFQSILFVDSNYRTYPTTMASAAVSTPIVLAIAVVVTGEWIVDGNYFELRFGSQVVGNASDFLTFSTTTLVLFLVKLVVLKKTRVHHSIHGYATIPCVVIKAALRYSPVTGSGSVRFRRGVREQPSKLESRGSKQPLLLSSLPLNRFDVNHTLLPYKFWSDPPQWVKANDGRLPRTLLYLIGGAAMGLLVFGTLRSFYELFLVQSLSEGDDPSNSRYNSDLIMIASTCCTVLFCGAFVPFYQRDLLRLLVRNFDFLFSTAQTLAFVLCMCDMHHWRLDRCLVVSGWWIWFLWALTLDALTPPINNRIFRFQKRWSAPVLAGMIAGGAASGLMLVLMPRLGLQDRVICNYEFAKAGVAFTVRTQTVMLGRAVTIVLWCSRQAFLRMTHNEDELILIRGNVEYVSPYSTFPRRSTHGVAAINESSGSSTHSEAVQPRVLPNPPSFIKPRRIGLIS